MLLVSTKLEAVEPINAYWFLFNQINAYWLLLCALGQSLYTTLYNWAKFISVTTETVTNVTVSVDFDPHF